MSIPLDLQCEILRGGARKGQESPAQDSKTQYANPDVSGIGVRPLPQTPLANS